MRAGDRRGDEAPRVAALVVIALLLALLVPPGAAGAVADAAVTKPEGVAFWYQRLRPEDVPKLGRPQLVVLGTQGGAPAPERAAVDTVHGLGASAYRYSHFFTFSRADQGIDLTAHPDWEFCGEDGSPFEYLGAPVLDLNERAVDAVVTAWLREVKAWGYDGVFLDQGATATTAPGFWETSTCTADPVVPGRTMSDTYAVLVTRAHAVGLTVFANMGRYALTRPDPADPSCRARRWDRCRVLDDVVQAAEYVLVENRPIFPPTTATEDPNLAEELDWLRPAIEAPRGRAAPVALGKVWAAPSQTGRIAFYLAAVARVAGHPVAVGVGDDRCGEPLGSAFWICGRGGVAPPRLVSTRLGTPLDPTWSEHGCDPDGTHCLIVRRYRRGMVVLNPTNRTRDTGRVPLGLDGCRVVQRRSTGLPVGNGACLDALRRMPGAFTGELYMYAP